MAEVNLNIGKNSPKVQVDELKKVVYLKTNDMPNDSVSFGKKSEDKSKSKYDIIAGIVGAVMLIGGALWAFKRGRASKADGTNIMEKVMQRKAEKQALANARRCETRRFNKEHRVGKNNIYSAEQSAKNMQELWAEAEKIKKK